MVRFVHRATLGREQKESGLEHPTAQLTTVLDPNSAASRAYRSLRTNLLYSSVDPPRKVIVVTSPGHHEGKSMTCANLGVVLAQAGKRTLILDCDFHNPAIHKFFGLPNAHGIMDVVVEGRSLQEVCEEPVDGLKVVCVGPKPHNPAEITDSRSFSEFLAGARDEFDYVLIDSPPIELVSDSVVLATQGDGVLLVVDAQTTHKLAVRQAVRSLETVGVEVIGTVMTNVKVKASKRWRL